MNEISELNSTDQLEGGFVEAEALSVIEALGKTRIDLIDISGGTYFPGAKLASDSSGSGPYFVEFAKQARRKTTKPLMVTGGFKTRGQAVEVIDSGYVDVVGIARALVLDPALPKRWQAENFDDLSFPKFNNPPEGGITAWYSMRLTEIGEDRETGEATNLEAAIDAYNARDRSRTELWNARFQK